MQNQVNLGDVVKAEFNGTEADGVVTWVSSYTKVVIFQQQDTGHLFWTDVDNLIEVKSSVIETKGDIMQEQEFQIGDKVVVLTTLNGYQVGEVISSGYYEDESEFYYEVYFEHLKYSSDYIAEDLYDLEGLSTKSTLYNAELVKVVDELDELNILVVDSDDNVMCLSKEELEDLVEDDCQTCQGFRKYAEQDCEDDSIIQELRKLLQQRSATGIRKYGTTLDRNDLDSSEWCQHLLEELLDASGYVLRLKKDLEALEIQ